MTTAYREKNAMTTIQIDEATAEALAAIAKSKGVTVDAYLRDLVRVASPTRPSSHRSELFDRELEMVAFDGPTLPDDFSRADIYADDQR